MIHVLVLFLCWIVPVIPSLRGLAHVYVTDADFSHGILVPLFAVYAARRVWPRARIGGARWPGVLAVLVGGALLLLGGWYEAAFDLADTGTYGHVFLQGMGAVLSLAGFCAVGGGWRLARAWLFPLAYLMFAVPLPESLVVHVTVALQRLSAICACWLLRLVGIVVFREGNVLHLPRGSLGIAEACSGLRSIYVLAAAGTAVVWLYRLRPHATAVLLMLIPVLVVLANTLRIVLSGVFVHFGHAAWVASGAHDALGLVTTAVVACALFTLAMRWRREPPNPPCGSAHAQGTTLSWHWIGVLGALSLCIGAVELRIHAQYTRVPVAEEHRHVTRRPFSVFPRRLGSFVAVEDGHLRAGELAMLQPSDHLRRMYRGPDGEPVALTLLYWAPYRTSFRGRRDIRIPHNPDICYPGVGWRRERVADSAVALSSASGRTFSVRYYTRSGERTALAFWSHFRATDPSAWIPRRLAERWHELRASWRDPRRELVQPRFAVYVAAVGRGGPQTWPELRARAVTCAEEVIRAGADFGLGTANTEEPPQGAW